MQALAGAMRLDGSSGPGDLALRMCAALSHRGSCSTIDVCGSRPQIAFHGRIDNRRELAASLRPDRPETSDGELTLAAYAAWGESCAPRLLGDFAFAVWDPSDRSLFCARDIVGVKPFFYAVVEGTFLFASELHALFQHPKLERTPDEAMAAELLNGAVTSREETLFKDIRRLPPAHSLRVRNGMVTSRRYWAPSVPAAEPHHRDADYADELDALLREAVRCRVDGAGAAAQLSGGLDSSAVAAVASSLLAAPAVSTYSLVFPGRPFDESAYIAAVVRRLRVRNTPLDVPPWDGEWFAAQASQYFECPFGPTAAVLTGMFRAARADGASSMLTGEGADEWFTGSMQSYADLVARGALRAIASELVHAPRRGTALRRLLFAGIWPLVPQPLRTAVRPVARAVLRREPFVPWLQPAFARRTEVADRCRRPEYDSTSGVSRATWSIAQYLADGGQALAFEIADGIAARCGIEERHPFYDRRIIEFALALPESQRARCGVRKRVLRNAMSGLLPDVVCRRADKADFSPLYLDWFAAMGGEAACDRLAITDAGWVRADVLKREYRRAAAAAAAGDDASGLAALWSVVAVDAWFRAAIAGEPLGIGGGVAVS